MPVCLGCGYALEGIAAPGSAGTCPECGQTFDLSDPNTLGPPRWSLAKVIAAWAPPRWFCMVYVLPWLYITVIWGTPSGNMADDPSVLLILFCWATGLIWAAGLIVMLVARAIVALGGRSLPPWRWTWLAIPGIAAAGLAVHQNGLVWKLRWWHARAEFNAIRQRMATGGPPPPTPCWVGTFHVMRIESSDAAFSWLNPPGLGRPPVMVYWLGWPDNQYSDGWPAMIETDTEGMPGAVVDEGWFEYLDAT